MQIKTGRFKSKLSSHHVCDNVRQGVNIGHSLKSVKTVKGFGRYLLISVVKIAAQANGQYSVNTIHIQPTNERTTDWRLAIGDVSTEIAHQS